ncbi:MAG: GCN5-related N-acetyltransferase [Hyphomicrobiales bacterium]|nr:GCN5-related N-acetyltransferase [Hyphomicrobiales bacterium]
MQELIRRSGIGLAKGFYSSGQAAAVTREVFGVDTQLVLDGTYFVIEDGAAIVACGGWGKRSTAYGGDHAKSEPDRLLDPVTEPARIRAFFVEPAMARRGLGTMLMKHCALAAAAAGFGVLELTATLPGEPLYRALGFEECERFELALSGGVGVPLVRMRRVTILQKNRGQSTVFEKDYQKTVL